jgi:hypothetical protein
MKTTSPRDQIAKENYAQTRAMNRTLKKARAGHPHCLESGRG